MSRSHSIKREWETKQSKLLWSIKGNGKTKTSMITQLTTLTIKLWLATKSHKTDHNWLFYSGKKTKSFYTSRPLLRLFSKIIFTKRWLARKWHKLISRSRKISWWFFASSLCPSFRFCLKGTFYYIIMGLEIRPFNYHYSSMNQNITMTSKSWAWRLST